MNPKKEREKKATFAGGCFWCINALFHNIRGVSDIKSGYSGGKENTANYDDVSTGKTKHREAVQLIYDEDQVSYHRLVEEFLKDIDPTDDEGQFADRGEQYKAAIYYHDQEQKRIAEEEIHKLDESNIFNKEIKVDILPYKNFFVAEKEHQNYHERNKISYEIYSEASGRKPFLRKIWGDEHFGNQT